MPKAGRMPCLAMYFEGMPFITMFFNKTHLRNDNALYFGKVSR
jgi:hypothetical protein